MGEGFKRREPTEPSSFYNNLEMVEIFQKCEWLGYFERLRGFDDEVSIDFSHNFHSIQY
jgi:hypothetical protein